MAAPAQFEGFMINSTDKWSDFSKQKVRSHFRQVANNIH